MVKKYTEEEKKRLRWFRSGGFEKDSLLTKKDKDYYWKKLDKDELEIRKIREKVKEKNADWLGRWLQKFSIEGDFWSKERLRKKIKKEDWL